MHSIISAMNQRRAIDRQRGVGDGLWGTHCFLSWSNSSDADIDENDYTQLMAIHNEVYANDLASYYSDEEDEPTATTYEGLEDESTALIDSQEYTLDDLIGSHEDDTTADWSNTSTEMAAMATPGRRRFPMVKFVHKILLKMRQCWGQGDKDDGGGGANDALHWIEGAQEVTPCPSMHNAALAAKGAVAVPAGSWNEATAFIEAITNKMEVKKNKVDLAMSVSDNDINTTPMPLPARFQGIRPESSLQARGGTWVIRVFHHTEKMGPETLRFDLMQQDLGCFIPLYGSEILAPINCIIYCVHDPDDVEFQVWTNHHGKEQMLLVDSDCILAHLAVLMGIEAAKKDNHYSYFQNERKKSSLRQQLLIV